ncbi:MAG: S8 family serine peptidase, partial [Verrucomicrobiota bacterium]
MRTGRKAFWALIGLFLVFLALVWFGGRDSELERTDGEQAKMESPAAAENGDEQLASRFSEEKGESSESSTSIASTKPDQIQPAAAEPRFELSDRTAKEKLVENAEILDLVDVRIGLSNRIVRKTLYRTSFKYPLVLKREIIEIDEEEEDTVIAEEWMVGDHVLVKLPNETDEAALGNWAAKNGYAIRSRLRTAPIVMLSSSNPGVETVDSLQNSIGEFFQSIGADPLVQVAEPDYVYFPTATPNDPNYSNLWGLHNSGQSGGTNDADIDGPEALDITSDASDVLVGVIDTGVDRAHPDLAANMWTNPLETPGNGVDDDNNGFIDDVNGWDFFDNDNDPTDGGSHGTHCAGTIGAVGNNGVGVVGTAWNASLVGIRFLGPTGGTTSGAIESVNYATTLGVDLTSNSWGGGGFSTLLQDAIESGDSAGILFVAAAGNEGVNNDANPHYPSSYASAAVISVAASDHNDLKASFSNYGQVSVDLAAPGVNTYSTVPNSGYGNKSGTSMATPHVSGAVALIRSLAPHLTNAELKQLLIDSVDLVPAFSSNTVSGGRLNLYDAILEVGGPSLRLVEFTVDDEGAPGNGDGFINPGEPVRIDLKIANQGTEAADNVTATLIREPGTVFGGDGGAFSVGNIATGGQADVSDAFTITAAAGTTTPYQEEIAIRLEWGTSPRLTRDFTKTLTVSTSSQISGRVTAITGGAAISGAVISYSGPLSGTIATDASGNYQFTAIDGDYMLSAAAAGFAQSAPRSVTVPPNRAGIDFALGKPDLDVDPASVALTLFSGQSTTRTLTVTNEGDTPLDWTLDLAQANAQTNLIHTLPEMLVAEGDPDDPDSQGVERTAAAVAVPMADLTGSRIGLLVDWSYATFEDDLEGRGAQVVSTLEFPLAAGDLDDFDVVMIDDAITRATSGDVTIIRDFV